MAPANLKVQIGGDAQSRVAVDVVEANRRESQSYLFMWILGIFCICLPVVIASVLFNRWRSSMPTNANTSATQVASDLWNSPCAIIGKSRKSKQSTNMASTREALTPTHPVSRVGVAIVVSFNASNEGIVTLLLTTLLFGEVILNLSCIADK